MNAKNQPAQPPRQKVRGRWGEPDGAYLHRLANGSKTSPSEDVIKKLGLRRIVSYVRCV